MSYPQTLSPTLAPPGSLTAPFVTWSGRNYPNAPVVIDAGVLTSDYQCLTQAGWVQLSEHTGPTAQRPKVDPSVGGFLRAGFRHMDTTLGRLIVWNGGNPYGGNWIDAITGAAA